jgi:hypothetical protein
MKTKNCPKCKIEKLLSEFHKDKSRPLGVQVFCKECVKYRSIKIHPEYPNNKTKVCSICKQEKLLSEFNKHNTCLFGRLSRCKICENIIAKKNYKKCPWKNTLKNIMARCTHENEKSYKDYGGRGIKCLITEDELKELWFRDKACEMEWPSFNRKNNDGNYTFDNCEYTEFGKNVADRNKRNSK